MVRGVKSLKANQCKIPTFGLLFLIQSLSDKSIRVCHPSHVALKFSITSGERRMVVETLADSNAGLPTCA